MKCGFKYEVKSGLNDGVRGAGVRDTFKLSITDSK